MSPLCGDPIVPVPRKCERRPTREPREKQGVPGQIRRQDDDNRSVRRSILFPLKVLTHGDAHDGQVVRSAEVAEHKRADGVRGIGNSP